MRQRLGLEPFKPGNKPDRQATRQFKPRVVSSTAAPDRNVNSFAAIKNWQQAVGPLGSIVETHLRNRGLDLPAEIAGEAIRYHPRCPWNDNEGITQFVPAMIAPFRDIRTNRIVGIHRTRLAADGSKIDRKMLGQSAGAAIKLDVAEAVGQGLVIGEGIETCLAARQLGLRPVWAMGSASAIAKFERLPGIEGLTILCEADEANKRAVRECADRWLGVEVILVKPLVDGADMNDVLRRVM
jgi:hypothetical protein